TRMYAARGAAIVEELRVAGEYDPELEREARSYTNPIVMGSFARRLNAIAAKMR
ncbi:MAG: hypothetical protein QOF63_3491, partial [Thermoanaerobaculia bacterium]|nr:hypothetical protein [Thermoanaerobaculia bacterium]